MEFCQPNNPITVRKSEVPAYLRCGVFFQSLSDEDDEQISVPSNTLKMDTKIDKNADLEHLLSSLRFWGVSNVCEEIVSFCLSKTGADSELDKILRSFATDFPYANTLAAMIPVPKELARVKIAVESGLLEIVRKLPLQGSTALMGSYYAAQYGHLHILQYIHEQTGQADTDTLDAALQTSKGMACLQYLHKQGIPWPADALSNALVCSSKEIFHYALQNGCAWDMTAANVELACNIGPAHLEALQYAIQHGGYPLAAMHTTKAAQHGALQSLQILHEANCPWIADACTYAAYGGHLEVLRYLHENGCPWNSTTLQHALEHGQIMHWNTPARLPHARPGLQPSSQAWSARHSAVFARSKTPLGCGHVQSRI